MSMEVPVDVKIKGFNTPANLMLKGFTSSESGFGGAHISLGDVEVLHTDDIYLDYDIKRIEKEIKNGTLSIVYKWDESLVPTIEMMGERKNTIKKLKDSLRHKNYEFFEGVYDKENAVLYVSVKNNVGLVYVGRSGFDTDNSDFFIDVKCRRRPTNDLLDNLNDIPFPIPCVHKWGTKRNKHSRLFSYSVNYSLSTRTEPKNISHSLSRSASALVKVLQS